MKPINKLKTGIDKSEFDKQLLSRLGWLHRLFYKDILQQSNDFKWPPEAEIQGYTLHEVNTFCQMIMELISCPIDVGNSREGSRWAGPREAKNVKSLLTRLLFAVTFIHSPCDIKISQFFLSFKSQAIAIICLEIKNVPTWWSSLMVFNEDSLVKSSKDSNRKVSNWSHSSFCRYDCKVVMFCMSRKCVICSELCFIFVCMSL
jgi:hypothetical protein